LSGNARLNLANSVTRLKPDYDTLAEALKGAGYATGHYGKWHLGHKMAPGDAYEPKDQGFDVDWPHTPRAPGPGGGYFAPWSKFITDPAITDEAGRHVDERMADEAERVGTPRMHAGLDVLGGTSLSLRRACDCAHGGEVELLAAQEHGDGL
jgi:arylsulfatase A-like enzyme